MEQRARQTGKRSEEEQTKEKWMASPYNLRRIFFSVLLFCMSTYRWNNVNSGLGAVVRLFQVFPLRMKKPQVKNFLIPDVIHNIILWLDRKYLYRTYSALNRNQHLTFPVSYTSDDGTTH